jgi:predicted PurR-regulated permease PerM
VFTLVTLALVLVPTYFIAASLVDTARDIGVELSADELVVPPPPEPVRQWPLIGRPTYDSWLLASQNLSVAVKKFEPQLRALGGRLIGAISGVGAAVVQSLIAIIVAGLFLATAGTCAAAMRGVAGRIGGEMGMRTIDMSAATIRSVAQGVIGVALIQGLLAGIGLFLVHVPAAGLWTIAVMVLAIVQLPPILILGPIAAYVFSLADNTTVAVIFTVWSLIVSGSDAFLKPLFLGRGVAVPMPVILIGAIGGMILHGMIGLFVGAVILAMGYTLVSSWLEDDETPTASASAPRTAGS